jgi:hypothetical protein
LSTEPRIRPPAERQYDRRRRRVVSPRRRLGSVEYTLLALILLGVVITIAMAIMSP